MLNNFTEKQLQEITDKYSDGMLMEELSREYGICRQSIGDYLREQGFYTRFKKLEWEQKYDIIEEFLTGTVSMRQLGKKYGVNGKTIRGVIKRYDSSIDTSVRQATKKHVYSFLKIKEDSLEKYYWLGFIMADGNVYKNSLSINLHPQDKVHLEKFKAFMQYTGKVEDRKWRDEKGRMEKGVRIRINDKNLAIKLLEYGIAPNKSLTATPLNIPPRYIRSFILGIYDGDGTKVGKKRRVIAFSGSRNIIHYINLYFHKTFGKIFKVTDKGTSCSLPITSMIWSYKILKDLYSGHEKFCLERKHVLFKELEQYINNRRIK